MKVMFSRLISILLMLSSCFISMYSLYADASYLYGKVNLNGAIIDAPCAIDVESRDQTIELSTISIGRFVESGGGPKKNFIIKLVNCDLKRLNYLDNKWNAFNITFDGAITNNNLFAVNGEAQGVGLLIIDANGNRALPGVPLPNTEIEPGQMLLRYTMQLQSNNKKLRAGAYYTTIRFKMEYF
ncbi:fimbrial protein [Klebsiella pneumoniae]|uniref:fimbrial protein n=1 Tax=Klebsiella pneumoniae TaxID=573 RepID=UPI0034CE2AA8